jgi:hypothetical protein
VVVDISRNTELQQMYNDGTLDDWGNQAVNPKRESVPKRVLVILHDVVVADYGQGWGPAPIGRII